MVGLKSNIDGLQHLPVFDSDWEKSTPYEFGPLAIVIEYLAGEARTKVKDTGVVVSGIMPTAYGYILRTTDIHGEEIDMYLAPMADRDAPIFVIDQVHPDNKIFDEHKVMLGFGSVEEAVHNYLEAFGDGSGMVRLGAITEFSGDAFVEWVSLDGSSLLPASKFEVDGCKTTAFWVIGNPPRQTKPISIPIDEAGGVVISLPDISNGPKLHTSSSEMGCFEYSLYLYSALDICEWSMAVDTFCRTLCIAKESDTVHIHIVSPGGSVVLMGRIISAIASTKAKVITYAEGEVGSAATTIWAAGHERHILPGAYFMQHMSSQLLEGKTTDIAAKSKFCVNYITDQLNHLIDIQLFTEDEVLNMVERSADVYVGGPTAAVRTSV